MDSCANTMATRKKRSRCDLETGGTTTNSKAVEDFKVVMEGMSVADICSQDPDMLLALLSMKFSYNLTQKLIDIVKVIPVSCGPWRKELCLELLNLVSPSPNYSLQEALEAILSCKGQHTTGTR